MQHCWRQRRSVCRCALRESLMVRLSLITYTLRRSAPSLFAQEYSRAHRLAVCTAPQKASGRDSESERERERERERESACVCAFPRKNTWGDLSRLLIVALLRRVHDFRRVFLSLSREMRRSAVQACCALGREVGRSGPSRARLTVCYLGLQATRLARPLGALRLSAASPRGASTLATTATRTSARSGNTTNSGTTPRAQPLVALTAFAAARSPFSLTWLVDAPPRHVHASGRGVAPWPASSHLRCSAPRGVTGRPTAVAEQLAAATQLRSPWLCRCCWPSL